MMNYGYQSPFQYQTQPIYNQVQQQTPQQRNSLPGRIVNNIEEVNANEIPMDGNCAYFVTADGSEIYGKKWLPSGTIATTHYKSVLDNVGVQDSKKYNEEVKGEFKAINERLDKIEDLIGGLKTTPKRTTTKKEVSE